MFVIQLMTFENMVCDNDIKLKLEYTSGQPDLIACTHLSVITRGGCMLLIIGLIF